MKLVKSFEQWRSIQESYRYRGFPFARPSEDDFERDVQPPVEFTDLSETDKQKIVKKFLADSAPLAKYFNGALHLNANDAERFDVQPDDDSGKATIDDKEIVNFLIDHVGVPARQLEDAIEDAGFDPDYEDPAPRSVFTNRKMDRAEYAEQEQYMPRNY